MDCVSVTLLSRCEVRICFCGGMNSLELCSLNRRNELASSCPHSPGGGGTWVFFGWGRAARDSKLAPGSKKKPPKVMPRSRNGPIFVYPVLEFVLKLIPRSGNGPVYPRWRSQRSRLAPKYARPAR